jgi:signal transduction histidine kinase
MTIVFSRSPLLKVFLVFVAGIILPTMFLVYLGVQSIQSETLLLKKEAQERVGKTAQAIHDQAQLVIGEALAPFVQLAKTVAPASSVARHALIQVFKKTHASTVSWVILLDSNNRLVYPIRETRRSPVPSLQPLSLEQRQQMQQAETAEFRDGDLPSALKGYRALQKEVVSPRWKAILLSSQAGCLLKLKQFDGAAAEYQEILSRYSHELDAQGYPFGLVIAAQLGELHGAAGRPDLSAASTIRVFQDLIMDRWDLAWDEIQFFVRHLTTRLQALERQMTETDRAHWRQLTGQWEETKRAAVDAKSFMSARWPVLSRTLQEKNRAGMPFLLFTDDRANHAVAYVPWEVSTAGGAPLVLVADLNATPLIQKLSGTVESLADASNLAYRLETGAGAPLAQSGTLPENKVWAVEATLSQAHPSLHLAVAPLSSVPAEKAAARRKQVYFGMVILAVIVILIALYATWYALSREMEVAQLKARFVAGISHELKTPLSIIGFIGQKLQLGRYGSPEEVQDYYAMISEETGRLRSLIDEVLDFSRLMENRQPYDKKPADLLALVQETAERFRHSHTEDRLELECRCEPGACLAAVDKDAFSRALLNLLDNAVKYSPPGRTHVAISLKRMGAAAVIQVEDHGYGIAPEEKDLIFDRFYRGRSASDQQTVRGAGLGLSIVKHIVTAHEGEIDLQSTLGKGSIFTIRIPIEDAHA